MEASLNLAAIEQMPSADEKEEETSSWVWFVMFFPWTAFIGIICAYANNKRKTEVKQGGEPLLDSYF